MHPKYHQLTAFLLLFLLAHLSQMGPLVDLCPLAFFLFISVSSLQIQARESLFFSKAIRYETPKESTAVPKGMYGEPEKKLYPRSQDGYGVYLPAAYTNTYDYRKNGVNGLTSRSPANEFSTEIYENNANVARYESGNGAFSSRIFEDGEYQYGANAEGHYDGYNRGISYEYNSGSVGYQNNQKNHEKEEGYVP